MTVGVSIAIIVWSCAAAAILGYVTLFLTSRNGDTPWLAATVSGMIVFGGLVLATEGSLWVIGGFVLIVAQLGILYELRRQWRLRASRPASKELTT